MDIKKYSREEFDKLEEKTKDLYEVYEGKGEVSYYYFITKLPYGLGRELVRGIGIQHLYICTEDRFNLLSSEEIDNSSCYLVIGNSIKLVYAGNTFYLENKGE